MNTRPDISEASFIVEECISLVDRGEVLLPTTEPGDSTVEYNMKDKLEEQIKASIAQCKPQYAPFLDGLRGFAAYSVAEGHSYSRRPLSMGIWRLLADLAVRMFFVLSSFLITYRLLLEWHKVQLQKSIQAKNFILPTGIDLASADPDNLETMDMPANPPASILQKQIWSWRYYKPEFLILARYTVQRIMRIYPLYLIVLGCAYSSQLGKTIWNINYDSTLTEHLLLLKGDYIFWSISLEMKFYCFIPWIVIAYYLVSHNDLSWVTRCLRRSQIGRTSLNYFAGRIELLVRWVLVVSYFGGLMWWMSVSVDVARHPTPTTTRLVLALWYSDFLAGCVAALLYAELQIQGLLPNSGKGSVVNTPPFTIGASTYQSIRAIPTRITQYLKSVDFRRSVADVLCYIAALFWCATSIGHYKYSPTVQRFLGKTITNLFTDYSNQMEGIPFAVGVFMALYANKSFARLFEFSLLRFFGKISFSMYLWHPLFLHFVFDEWFKNAVVFEGDNNDEHNGFDKYIVFISLTIVFSTISQALLETAFQKMSHWINTRYFTEKK